MAGACGRIAHCGSTARRLIAMTVWISKRPDDEVAAEPGPKPRCSGRYPAGGERQRGRSGAADDGGVSGVRLSAGTRHRGGRGIARRWRGRRRQDEPRPVRHGLVGTRSPYGLVPDSRRPDFISGVSSSGSAVAVANGEADIAIGTDTAGSGRVPAGLQGIVGIKPTVGVIRPTASSRRANPTTASQFSRRTSTSRTGRCA